MGDSIAWKKASQLPGMQIFTSSSGKQGMYLL